LDKEGQYSESGPCAGRVSGSRKCCISQSATEQSVSTKTRRFGEQPTAAGTKEFRQASAIARSVVVNVLDVWLFSEAFLGLTRFSIAVLREHKRGGIFAKVANSNGCSST